MLLCMRAIHQIILLMFLEAKVGIQVRNWRQVEEVLPLRGPRKLQHSWRDCGVKNLFLDGSGWDSGAGS